MIKNPQIESSYTHLPCFLWYGHVHTSLSHPSTYLGTSRWETRRWSIIPNSDCLCRPSLPTLTTSQRCRLKPHSSTSLSLVMDLKISYWLKLWPPKGPISKRLRYTATGINAAYCSWTFGVKLSLTARWSTPLQPDIQINTKSYVHSQ